METHPANGLRVYQKLLMYWIESDQRRRSRHIKEMKESDEKIKKSRFKTVPEKKERSHSSLCYL
jgi:hypothetical protein